MSVRSQTNIQRIILFQLRPSPTCGVPPGQGNVEASFHLGVMYLKGWGIKPNAQLAQYQFNLAAKMKHLLAMYNLAMMYLASTDKSAPCPACLSPAPAPPACLLVTCPRPSSLALGLGGHPPPPLLNT